MMTKRFFYFYCENSWKDGTCHPTISSTLRDQKKITLGTLANKACQGVPHIQFKCSKDNYFLFLSKFLFLITLAKEFLVENFLNEKNIYNHDIPLLNTKNLCKMRILQNALLPLLLPSFFGICTC